MNKTLFISQPMNGLTDKEIHEVRERSLEHVRSMFPQDIHIEDIDQIMDIKDSGLSGDRLGLLYLSRSLELLSKADFAYFIDGWEDARGCRIEHDCAVAYNIPIIQDA